MNHDPHGDAELYAADALEPDERAAFEQHLADCPDCVQTVVALQSMTASLSEMVAVQPPTALRAAVLHAIATTPQADSANGTDAVEAVATTTGARVAPPTRLSPADRRRWLRPASLVAAAAVLVALGCLGWALNSQHQANVAQGRQQELTRLLAAGDVRTVTGNPVTGGRATLVLSRSQGEAVLVVSGLPSPPAGKVYELWRVDRSAHPAGTFRPTASGQTVVTLPASVAGAQQVAMTVEPAGGSAQPTTKPVLAVAVPSG